MLRTVGVVEIELTRTPERGQLEVHSTWLQKKFLFYPLFPSGFDLRQGRASSFLSLARASPSSQLGGCPGWNDLADAALRFFLKLGKIDHAQFDQLSQLPARVKLSVAIGLENQFETKIDFRSILEPSDADKRAVGAKIYGHLAKLGRTFVTTNYDKWLDLPSATAPLLAETAPDPSTASPASKRSVYYLPEQFTDALSTPDTVLHIHGSVDSRESMILATSDYLHRYASHRLSQDGIQENSFLTFLEHLFRTKSVLFIGYSLSELEVLEYVIQKAKGAEARTKTTDPREPQEEPRHYLLQGFFTHEAALMRSFHDYYLRECNIGLLPYSKDQRGWAQLIDVLEYLAREIPVVGLLASQQRLEMEALLE